MSQPKIELIPMRPAAKSDDATVIDVLIRITPPTPEVHFVRPPVNLGLVLDRSGSMAGARKMAYAREAAIFAVQNLQETDQVSVTIFDNVVETIYPNAPAADKMALTRLISGIQPRGATALHAGWKEGADQVERHLISDGLNRVILLSDGLANEGVTDHNVIAAEAKGRAARGVTTTTMGLGDDYNEDLMQAMGEAGDGNYYYIETPQQLADIFHTELKGLMATSGQKVSLGLEPQAGASVAEVLNEIDRNSFGRLMLPNLIVGMTTSIVVRLRIPAQGSEAAVLRVRLAWDDPKASERQVMHAVLTLKSVPSSSWEALPANPEVTEQVAILMAARAKKEAVREADVGNYAGSMAFLQQAHGYMSAAPSSSTVDAELADIESIQAHLKEGDITKYRKKAMYQMFRKNRGRE